MRVAMIRKKNMVSDARLPGEQRYTALVSLVMRKRRASIFWKTSRKETEDGKVGGGLSLVVEGLED